MQNEDEIVIIGGGLAGLIAGIHLQKNGLQVRIIEQNKYPKHKVCGEYISNEVLPYLTNLGLDIQSLKPKKIDFLLFSLVSGKSIQTKLPLGGFGISRYQLDNYLFEHATRIGCIFCFETVQNIDFDNDIFKIATHNNYYHAKLVLGAFGKRSNIDINLKRTFIQKKSNWLGVKAHYKLDFDDDLVGLHHFNGGYCGVSKIENNNVNICYLANYKSFKKCKSIDDFQESIVCQNPFLKSILQKAVLQFDKPLSISQISFDKKNAVENHILMIGDSAGLIHPLCGNGMAMAIHSAKLACESCIDYIKNHQNRNVLENEYVKNWNTNFKRRLQIGRLIAKLIQNGKWGKFLLQLVLLLPFLLPIIIKKTHGKPI